MKRTTSSLLAVISFIFMTAGTISVTVPLFFETNVPAGGSGTTDSIDIWVAPDPNQSLLFITSKTKDRIEYHDPVTNTFLGTVGDNAGDPELAYPNGVRVAYDVSTGTGTTDALFITERDNARITVLALPSLTLLGQFGTGTLAEPYGVAMHWAGSQLQAWITDTDGADEVFVFDVVPDGSGGVTGTLNFSFETASNSKLESIVIDSHHQRALICDEEGGDVMVYDLNGNFVSRFGSGDFANETEGIVIYDTGGGNGYIIVADQNASPTEFEFFDRVTFDCIGHFTSETTGTDGTGLTQRPLPNLPSGSFYAINSDREGHAFDWADIASAMGLQTVVHGNDPAITVSSPNGGESWENGSTQQITWSSSSFSDPVKIEFSSDNGGNWSVLASGVSNTGAYNWTINESATSTALVRVSDNADSDPSDVSDAAFSIIAVNAASNLAASAINESQIDLTWDDNSEVEDGFKIERHDGDGNFVEIAQTGANVTSFSDNGLANNTTYTYRVRAFKGGDNSAYSNEASATTSSNPQPPTAPTSLSASTVSDSEIDLSWNDNASDEDGFKIERHDGDGNFAEIAQVGANVTSFNDTGLSSNTTYTYRVRAFNGVGDSGYSNEASATTDSSPPPAAPSGLVATASGASQIDLSWNDNSGNEDGFKIERHDGDGNFAEVAQVGANVTSYSDVGLAASTTYTYRVFAFNGSGDSNYSNEASATTDAGGDPNVNLALNKPTTASTTDRDVTPEEATDGDLGTFWESKKTQSGVDEWLQVDLQQTETVNRVVIAWQDKSYATSFEVQVSSDASFWTTVVNGTRDDEGTDDFTFAATGARYVRLLMHESKKSTLKIDEFEIYGVGAPPSPPASPSGLSATANGSSQIDLGWSDNSNNESGFKIERHDGDGNFAEIAQVGAGVTSYGDTGLSNNTTYTYRVRAFNGAGNSGYSNEASATTDPPPPPPADPSGLSATANGSSQIDLSWTDNSNNESGFKIERHSGDGNFAEIAQVGADVTSYDDTGLSSNTTYTYRVRAFNGVGNSGYSNEASATTDPPPPPPADPSGLSATANGSSQIDLSWTDNSNNEDGFKIERHGGDGNFAEIAQVGAGVTSYDDTGLSSNTTYTYRVRAFNGAGNSAYSNEASATTDPPPPPPADPSGLNATANGSSQIDLNWADNSNNEDGFKIERHSGDGNFAEIAQVGADVTSYDDTGLSSNTTYTYRVRAFNGAGDSGYSNEASATTDDNPVDPNVNLALDKPVAASGSHSSFVASNVNDGDEGSAWGVRNPGGEEWIRVDLESEQTVGRAIIRWSPTRFATDYELQVSDDDANWTTVYATSAGSDGDEEFEFTQTTARYVRLWMTGFNKSAVAVEELEIYAGPAEAVNSKTLAVSSELKNDQSTVHSSQPAVHSYALLQNYPNPFNPSTRIQFNLPEDARVVLRVYNMVGEVVATIADGHFQAGVHVLTFRPENLPSGVYFYRISAGKFSQTRRLIYMR